MKDKTIKIIQIMLIAMSILLIEIGVYILINHVTAALVMIGLDLFGVAYGIEWLSNGN